MKKELLSVSLGDGEYSVRYDGSVEELATGLYHVMCVGGEDMLKVFIDAFILRLMDCDADGVEKVLDAIRGTVREYHEGIERRKDVN